MIKEPSKKQIELLFRIAPGPLGKGMKIKAAAKDLGISLPAANGRLRRFKAKYPKAWENFVSMREVSRQDRYKLRWKRHPNQKVGLMLFTDLGFDDLDKWGGYSTDSKNGFRSRILED